MNQRRCAHLVVVVIVPLLQKGALLRRHLRADRGPAALRLLRGDVEGAAETLHWARVGRHVRKALKEAGGDAGVKVVGFGVGYRVNCVGRIGDGRRGGARLNGPRRSETGQGGGCRAAHWVLHLLMGEVRKSGSEHVIATGAVSVVDVVGAGGLHLNLHLGRWRIGVRARGGVGLRRQVGWGRLSLLT